MQLLQTVRDVADSRVLVFRALFCHEIYNYSLDIWNIPKSFLVNSILVMR